LLARIARNLVQARGKVSIKVKSF